MEGERNRVPLSRRQTMGMLWSGMLGLAWTRQSCSAQADNIAWLEQTVQAPPQVPLADQNHLAPLLVDSEGKTIKTLQQWERKRKELKETWREFLGPMPQARPSVELKTLTRDQDAGCIRQLVEYASEPGVRVQGYLLSPLEAKTDRLPGLVGLHQTTKFSIEEIAGLQGNQQQHLGPRLAQRGFVVFCPRNYLWQDAASYQEAVAKFKKRHPKTLGMHKMLYDAMRGVDVLESLPIVDSKHIGCVGHSLGGKEALYLAAFDDRIRATVASELGIGFSFSNWNAPWYLGPAIEEKDFPLEHHQLVAMIAPKPFLLLAGESGDGSVADGNRSWPYLEAAHPICRLYGRPVRIGMYNHRQGHTISAATFERLAEWLEVYLA